MKQLQYGCQQKLVNDFKMILLCFSISSFIQQEKDLLQARVKAINSILDNVAKQTEECRSQLASIISAQRLRECQGFTDKVGAIRFTRVKQRQLNKYNILLNKKEGNITRANPTTPTNSNNSTNSNNLASQADRQASPSLPPQGRQQTISNRQAGRCYPSLWGRRQLIPGRQSGRHSPGNCSPSLQ